MANLLGTTLGRYRLEELLGRGGMAQVFKAWDPNTQRYVAVKVLHQHLAEDPGFRERFSREGALIASLNHPNIVAIYDFDQVETETGTIHYMVMPLIEGPTLKERIEAYNMRQECMPLHEVVRIIEGIASALDYAHAKDMLHRDIKPGNILFDERDTPMLADFGLARLTFGARLTQSGVASGTPAYMAPEQGLGEPGDRRSDIYSLGIILHELLTGRLPFSADSHLGLIMKHVNEPIPPLRDSVPELPAAVEAVVYRATAKDPDSRYWSAAEMAVELRSAAEGHLVSKQTMSISQQQRVADHSRRRSLVAFAVVSVAAFVVFSVAVLRATIGAASPATPTVPAVSAMTGGAVPFSTDFNDDDEYSVGWPIREEGVFTSRIQDGRYILRSQAAGQAHTAIFSPEYYQYSSLIIETRATLSTDSQPDSGFGIVFRYVDEDRYYVFAINGRQEVSIWLRQNGEWHELRDGADEWTIDEAVAPPGEPNLLSVIADGDHITGFVNGTRVVDVTDDSIEEGAVGLYIATTVRPVAEVLTEVTFDNFTITNAVPSMSG